MRSSQNFPYETVWKIAEGVSARLSGGNRRQNGDSFDPSCPLSEPRFGTYPEFPNSFSRTMVKRGKETGPCDGLGKYRGPSSYVPRLAQAIQQQEDAQPAHSRAQTAD
jgi:hypothetical protein